MLKTLDVIIQPSEQEGLFSNSSVFRYNVDQTADGPAGEEDPFNIYTF